MEEDEARSLLFKPLDISGSSITFAGRTCRNVVFAEKEVRAAPWFHERLGLDPAELEIEGPTVRVVTTNCELEGFGEYLRLPDRRLLVKRGGVLLFFEPWVNY
ncbi:MAG: hypothetical protein Kow0089_05060 [Desulfobulbaceae bacterium]